MLDEPAAPPFSQRPKPLQRRSSFGPGRTLIAKMPALHFDYTAFDELDASETDELDSSENDELDASENDELDASENDELDASENDELDASENDELDASENDNIGKLCALIRSTFYIYLPFMRTKSENPNFHLPTMNKYLDTITVSNWQKLLRLTAQEPDSCRFDWDIPKSMEYEGYNRRHEIKENPSSDKIQGTLIYPPSFLSSLPSHKNKTTTQKPVHINN